MAKHKNISTKQLSSYLRKFTVGERSAIAKRSKEKIVSLKPKQRRKTSAFHVFRSEKWSVTAKVGTEAWKAEQQRVVAFMEAVQTQKLLRGIRGDPDEEEAAPGRTVWRRGGRDSFVVCLAAVAGN